VRVLVLLAHPVLRVREQVEHEQRAPPFDRPRLGSER
jgi:hypothetical protein